MRNRADPGLFWSRSQSYWAGERCKHFYSGSGANRVESEELNIQATEPDPSLLHISACITELTHQPVGVAKCRLFWFAFPSAMWRYYVMKSETNNCFGPILANKYQRLARRCSDEEEKLLFGDTAIKINCYNKSLRILTNDCLEVYTNRGQTNKQTRVLTIESPFRVNEWDSDEANVRPGLGLRPKT